MNLEVNAAGATLFMVAIAASIDTASALNSSPWTAENFGADPDKARSCREYVYWSIAISEGMGALSSWISKSWWPLLGTTLAAGLLWFLYERALRRAQASGSQGWS